MRHRKDHRKLSRTHEHRRALLRNLVTALFQYERIETTLAKAKETRRYAERMITHAKKGSLAARRHVATYVMTPMVTQKLFATIAPWYAERAGGYTRIIKRGTRLGDAGEMAILELVKSKEQMDQERKAAEAVADAKARRKEAKESGKKEPDSAKKEREFGKGKRDKSASPEKSVAPPAKRRAGKPPSKSTGV